MSLDYNLTKIANRKTVCFTGGGDNIEMRPVTEAMIFRTMSLDMGEITEKNWKEFMFRSRLYTKVFSAPMTRHDRDGSPEGLDFSPEDIKSHIGLTTNVSTKSRAGFLKRVIRVLEREAERSIAWELEKAEIREGTPEDAPL